MQFKKTKKNKQAEISHIVSVKDLSVLFIRRVFRLAEKIKQHPKRFRNKLVGKIFATVFYEPSTRTRLSFESAINQLGGRVISVENARESSSVYKGESLTDSIKTIANYVDAIILRHYDDDSAEVASKAAGSLTKIINAGAGKHEHPTQALLDAFTIYERFGRLHDLKMTIVGDLFRGRTVYSLVYLLSKFIGNKFVFVSRPNSKISEDLKTFLHLHQIPYEEDESLSGHIENTDILYVTRIQRERCNTEEEYQSAKTGLIIDDTVLKKLNTKAIIMHPLPRVDEISESVDSDPRAYYFKQVKNGVYVRMALLLCLFGLG